jgi:P27 family predicted phage terminase small subunit
VGFSNSGRRAQSTAVRLLRGNPGKRRPNPAEPMPAAAPSSWDAVPPEIEGIPAAAAEWARVVPILRACGLISTVERPLLLAVCRTWATYLDASAKVHELGAVTVERGVPTVSAWVKVADSALTQLRHLWASVGLTPSSRAGMTSTHAAPPERGGKWAGDL